jgi:phytoene synthase
MTAAAHAPQTAAATRASGSSFYFAMRILPVVQREAMFEIYSFCRAVDDIADGDAPRAERSAALAQWRRDIDALYAGSAPAALASLAKAVTQFGMRREDFLAVIDGMEMDAVEDIRAPDFAALDLYCDRVASAVGRLSVRVFGMTEQDGIALAHHLGRALQLTNILRDIDEDAGIGRLYLPREGLAAAGITSTDPVTVAAHSNLDVACRMVVERARSHFAEAEKIMTRSPRRAVRAPRIMGKAYRKILDTMAARGFAPPRQRVRISKLHLIGIALRYAFI